MKMHYHDQDTRERLDTLEEQYYEPSGTYEKYDPKTKQWYNAFGQRLRPPKDYDPNRPFGDE